LHLVLFLLGLRALGSSGGGSDLSLLLGLLLALLLLLLFIEVPLLLLNLSVSFLIHPLLFVCLFFLLSPLLLLLLELFLLLLLKLDGVHALRLAAAPVENVHGVVRILGIELEDKEHLVLVRLVVIDGEKGFILSLERVLCNFLGFFLLLFCQSFCSFCLLLPLFLFLL